MRKITIMPFMGGNMEKEIEDELKEKQEKKKINIFKFIHSKVNRKNFSQCLILIK